MDWKQKRIELQKTLETVIGSRNVYYQPPESIKLKYPCIIYNLDDVDYIYADGLAYIESRRFNITIIHKNPDNNILDKMKELKMCSFDRYFVSDGLYHYVYTIYL